MSDLVYYDFFLVKLLNCYIAYSLNHCRLSTELSHSIVF